MTQENGNGKRALYDQKYLMLETQGVKLPELLNKMLQHQADQRITNANFAEEVAALESLLAARPAPEELDAQA